MQKLTKEKIIEISKQIKDSYENRGITASYVFGPLTDYRAALLEYISGDSNLDDEDEDFDMEERGE